MSIGETAIQVRWYDNTMYSDRKQNIITLKTSVLLLHVKYDSNFLGIWSVYF